MKKEAVSSIPLSDRTSSVRSRLIFPLTFIEPETSTTNAKREPVASTPKKLAEPPPAPETPSELSLMSPPPSWASRSAVSPVRLASSCETSKSISGVSGRGSSSTAGVERARAAS